MGCLKGGKQHWYVTYVHRRDLFEKALRTEIELGYSIIKGITMEELEPLFSKMLESSENIPSGKFWSQAKKILKQSDEDQKPCECVF